jgi:hypothetical protein
VREFQDLTIRKWEEHLAKTQKRGASPSVEKTAEKAAEKAGARAEQPA